MMMDNQPPANGMMGDQDDGEGKLCRDFMRNVCNRGNSCRFIHPNDVKIKADPIFCHDYQQNKCFRATCKFIHCTREEEEHYKATGELPEGFVPEEPSYRSARGGGGGRGKPVRGVMPGRGGGRGGGAVRGWVDQDDADIPLCKDFLKGVCDRPPGGCKFRHVQETRGYRGSVRGLTSVPVQRRRLGGPGYYDEGPEAKRVYDGYATSRTAVEYEDYYGDYTNPPPPPPPQPYGLTGRSDAYGTGIPRNGFGASAVSDPSAMLNSYSSVTALKAVEDENFMLKRRIEELKKQVSDLVATNEYLLSQNATLRLSTMSAADKGAAPGTVNVTAASLASLVSMAQPMGLNAAAVSQSLSTMSTIPSVSMSMAPVSMSQPLEAVVSMAQHPSSVYPIMTTQGLPQGN